MERIPNVAHHVSVAFNDTDFPEVIELSEYWRLWPDLRELDELAARAHYANFGILEGRQANRLATREDFVALIPAEADALEIGPFFRPLLRGARTKYFDVMDTRSLEARALALGVHDLKPPEISFVSPNGNLDVVKETFNYVLSSHCLEHQPDLVTHLKHVARILRPGGRYFILVPDKRYCFDAFMAESTIADVLDAYHSSVKTHRLKSVIEHRSLTTHNDPLRHWSGDHGIQQENAAQRVLAALKEYESANGTYIDVHAWYFTPHSAQTLLNTLQLSGFTEMKIERLYPTRRNANEFWMILKK